MVTEAIFKKNKTKIIEVINSFNKTRYGLANPLKESVSSYADYCRLPILSSSMLSERPDELVLEPESCTRFMTSSTTGRSKVVYVPAPIMAGPLPEKIDELVKNTNTVFSYAAIDFSQEPFMSGHFNLYTKIYPNAKFINFSDKGAIKNILENFETLIIFDYPSSFAWFLYLVRITLDQGLVKNKNILLKNIYAKLTGEPMNTSTINQWLVKCKNDLNIDAVVSPRYGATEVQEIGGYTFSPSTNTINYELSHRNCLLEILDPSTLQPITEGDGLVAVTSFRTKGTILVRYLLGDKATIHIIKDTIAVSNISRPGTFSVVGIPISVDYFVKRLQEQFGTDIKLKIERSVSISTGIHHIKISLMLNTEILSKYKEDNIINFVKGLLIESIPLVDELINKGGIVLDILVNAFKHGEWARGKIYIIEDKEIP